MDVKKFEKAVRAFDRMCGGNGDDSLSGLMNAMCLHDAEDHVYQRALKTGVHSLLHYDESKDAEIRAAAQRGLDRAITHLALKHKLANRDAEIAKKEIAQAKEEAVYFDSPEFRAEVIAELVAEGATQLQAEGRTRDQARLYAEATRLNLM